MGDVALVAVDDVLAREPNAVGVLVFMALRLRWDLEAVGRLPRCLHEVELKRDELNLFMVLDRAYRVDLRSARGAELGLARDADADGALHAGRVETAADAEDVRFLAADHALHASSRHLDPSVVEAFLKAESLKLNPTHEPMPHPGILVDDVLPPSSFPSSFPSSSPWASSSGHPSS